MLASGAHIELAGLDLLLAEQVEEHYSHNYEDVLSPRMEITGAPGKQGVRQEILLWSFDNWSGGEGNKFYDVENPTVYYRGLCNPREPGELNPQPASTTGTATANATPAKIHFALAGGLLCMASQNTPAVGGTGHFYSSTNGTTWTDRDLDYTTGDTLTAIASDGTYVYASAFNAGTRKVRRWNATDPGTAGTQFANDVSAGGTVKFFGMAFLPIAAGGRLYGWTGKALQEFDTTAALPTSQTRVYHSGVETIGSGARGGIVTADNRVVFFYSDEGRSFIMEYGLGAQAGAKPFWEVPTGFFMRDIAYHQGVVFVFGDYEGKAAIWAIPLAGSPVFLGYVRPDLSVTIADGAIGLGGDLMVTGTTGLSWVYEPSRDAISVLDDLRSSGRTFSGLTTYKGKRIGGSYSGSTVTTMQWQPDDGNPNTTVDADWISPAWDLGFPHDDKVLLGFHIVSEALGAGKSITVAYDIDETGSYTSLTALSSGKNNYSALSTATTFRLLRMKLTLTGGPSVYSITARAYLLPYLESWDLAIDLYGSSKLKANSDLASRPDVLRYNILKKKEDKAAVAFRDGYSFQKSTDTAINASLSDPATSGYRSHTVVIERVRDSIEADGKGVLYVRLRSTGV